MTNRCTAQAGQHGKWRTMVSETVEVAFRWRLLGEVTLDGLGKLLFPQASAAPGVYRLEVDDDQASVYFGEATDLHQRFGRYRNAGRRQPTNIRIQELLCRMLSDGGRCQVSVAEILTFQAGRSGACLDLRLKAARVLVESAAIVLARNEGIRLVLNLDPAFDGSLGSP